MKILSIDTSRNKQSMTVFDNETDRFITKSFQAKSSFFVADLLKTLDAEKISPKDISLLATNIGPGSFTGIRTGISIVKTLASELDLEIFTANNFELIRYEKNYSGPFAIHAGLNDYYISLDEDYSNLEKNFFSYELGEVPLLDFDENTCVSELLVRYMGPHPGQSDTIYDKHIKLINYKDLKPYYLREPSIGKK